MNFKQKLKKFLSGFLGISMLCNFVPSNLIQAFAEETEKYPYMMFSSNNNENSIYLQASNITTNGKLCTNGTIYADATNCHLNGDTLENANENMIYIDSKLCSTYFNLETPEIVEDYIKDETNLSIKNSLEVNEDIKIDSTNLKIKSPCVSGGNINITSTNINIDNSIMAQGNILLNGTCLNNDGVVIYSQTGDIIINTTNASFDSLIYAPYGDVIIDATNSNINGIIIANSIKITGTNVNLNYRNSIATIVGLTSEDEAIIDTTKDTDGDGISDYLEINILQTDPFLMDTDKNGVLDGDEDADNDGLTNLKELEYNTSMINSDTDADGLNDCEEIFTYNTNPLIDDTDSDGLNDYDEIFTYNTNPLIDDTDSDGLNDGDEIFTYNTNPLIDDTDSDGLNDSDEITLGLSPTNPITDGITEDAQRKFFQNLSENQIDSELLSEDNLLVPSLSGNVVGVIDNNTYVEYNNIDAFNENDAIIGKSIYVTASYNEDCDMTLKYDYTSLLDYYDIKDISNLVICKYDNGNLIPLDTIVDYQNNDIYANITTSGIYVVIDIFKFFEGFGVTAETFGNNEEVEEELTIGSSENMPISFNTVKSNNGIDVEISGNNVNGQADIVFVIDNSSSMNSSISNVKDNITTFVNKLSENSVDCRFGVVVFSDSSNDNKLIEPEETYIINNGNSYWFKNIEDYKTQIENIPIRNGGDDPETSIEGLAMAKNFPFRNGANRFIILVTDDNFKIYNKYGITSIDEMANILSSANICTSVITSTNFTNNYNPIYSATDGIFSDIYGNFQNELLEISKKVTEKTNDGSWVLLNDYQYVKLDTEVSSTSGTDTDKDSLLDYNELGELKTYDLSSLMKLYLTKLGVSTENLNSATIEMYDYISNPILTDTDHDYYNDVIDKSPRKWQEMEIIDEKLNDDNSIDGTNPVVSNTDYTDGVLQTIQIDDGECFKNEYTFTRDANEKCEFIITPQKNSDYSISVSNSNCILSVSGKKSNSPWLDISQKQIINSNKSNNMIIYTLMLEKDKTYCISLDNSSSTNSKYTVNISQDNWVYAPYGAYKVYNTSFPLTTYSEYYLPDKVVYNIIKGYRIVEEGEYFLQNINTKSYLFQKSNTQLYNATDKDSDFLQKSFSNGKEKISILGDIGNGASLVGVALIPLTQESIVGSSIANFWNPIGIVVTLGGGCVALKSIEDDLYKKELRESMTNGKYNIILGTYTSDKLKIENGVPIVYSDTYFYSNSWDIVHYINDDINNKWESYYYLNKYENLSSKTRSNIIKFDQLYLDLNEKNLKQLDWYSEYEE